MNRTSAGVVRPKLPRVAHAGRTLLACSLLVCDLTALLAGIWGHDANHGLDWRLAAGLAGVIVVVWAVWRVAARPADPMRLTDGAFSAGVGGLVWISLWGTLVALWPTIPEDSFAPPGPLRFVLLAAPLYVPLWRVTLPVVVQCLFAAAVGKGIARLVRRTLARDEGLIVADARLPEAQSLDAGCRTLTFVHESSDSSSSSSARSF